jgi:hypothetical protein
MNANPLLIEVEDHNGKTLDLEAKQTSFNEVTLTVGGVSHDLTNVKMYGDGLITGATSVLWMQAIFSFHVYQTQIIGTLSHPLINGSTIVRYRVKPETSTIARAWIESAGFPGVMKS